MQFLQFTEFRNHSKECFDSVENGESFVIIRKGRPVARLSPFQEKVQAWKRVPSRQILKGKKTTSDFLREERDSG